MTKTSKCVLTQVISECLDDPDLSSSDIYGELTRELLELLEYHRAAAKKAEDLLAKIGRTA